MLVGKEPVQEILDRLRFVILMVLILWLALILEVMGYVVLKATPKFT